MSDTYEATALFLRQRVLILQARLAEVERDAARYRFIKQWARRLDITGYSLTNNEHFEPRIDEAMAIASQPSSADVERRPCTCHPDDNPPVPCPRMYALQDCRRAAALAAEIESLRARLAEAERDAVRYRWLRDRAWPFEFNGDTPADADAAIDAAMRPPAKEVLRNIQWAGNTDPELTATINMVADRHALLAAYDALAAENARLRAQIAEMQRVGRDVGDFDYPPGSAPCMCFFSTAEDRGPDPLGECDYHKALRARLVEAERTIARLSGFAK